MGVRRQIERNIERINDWVDELDPTPESDIQLTLTKYKEFDNFITANFDVSTEADAPEDALLVQEALDRLNRRLDEGERTDDPIVFNDDTPDTAQTTDDHFRVRYALASGDFDLIDNA
jgi:hypothetical protein